LQSLGFAPVGAFVGGDATARWGLFVVDPGHHFSEFAADLLDAMIAFATSGCFERWGSGFVLEDPVASEGAVLNLRENAFHLGFGFVGDDAWPADVIAVLGCVRHAVAHVVEAALVEEVDDQFQLVHALEKRHLGLVACFDECFVTGFYQGRNAAAQDDLLAEEIGFGFFSKGGADDSAPSATDAFGVGEARFEGFVARVVV